MAKKVLITSALPYVNNIPHLGNIVGSILSADVYARIMRLFGNEVLFIAGSDEHGTATEFKAISENMTPQEVCDKYNKIHTSVYKWFNISCDIFGRTSELNHHKITQQIFSELDTAGFIEEKEVKQLYCSSCDKFLADRFVEGTCPFCGYDDARGDQCDGCGKLLNPLDLLNPHCKFHDDVKLKVDTSTHLFLSLDKLQPRLESWFNKSVANGIWSENAKRITKSWFKEGLKSRSITRDLKWGVSVPKVGFENKVFYVWFDAPIGYISITDQFFDCDGKSWKEWWLDPENVELYQFMGKDNVPFHSIIFPACLLGTGKNYTTVNNLNSTEYLLYNGGKFSKSRGVGVFGNTAMESGLSSDSYRYYLMSHRPENSDSDFSWDLFKESYNSELMGNYANLVNRVVSFIDKFAGGVVPSGFTLDNLSSAALDFYNIYRAKSDTILSLFESMKIRESLQVIMQLSSLGNKFFQDRTPWKFVKSDDTKKHAFETLFVLAHFIRDLSLLISPFIPSASKNVFSMFDLDISSFDFSSLGSFGMEDLPVVLKGVLFEKKDDSFFDDLKKKCNGVLESGKTSGFGDSDFCVKVDGIKSVCFSDISLRVGKIIEVSKHPNADKLFVEKIDFGNEVRTVVSGLVSYYDVESMLGKNVIVVYNLKSAKLRGVLSQGMVLAVEGSGDVSLIVTDAPVGTYVSTPCGALLNNSKEISIDDFFKFDLKYDGGNVYFNDKVLLASNCSLKADKSKIVKGKVC